MTDTLKFICEQCTHLHNPQLEFIPKESHHKRNIILRDLNELVSASSLEHEKTVMVLAGGLFEAVLYCFIQEQSNFITARRGRSFAFDPEQNLSNFVNIFNRWFSDMLRIPDIIVDYRDMVHINRELKYPPDFCRNAARDILRLLNTLIGKLAEYAKA
jgi:hypothetical protein